MTGRASSATARALIAASPIASLDRPPGAPAHRRRTHAKLADAGVDRVADVDIAESVGRDAEGLNELTRARARAAPLGEERARRGELLDPLELVIGHVDEPR